MILVYIHVQKFIMPYSCDPYRCMSTVILACMYISIYTVHLYTCTIKINIIALYIVSFTNLETCQGLEQLAMNANPNFLSNCQRDSACTQVTCEGNGILSGQVDSAVLVLSPCEMPPGVVVKLIQGGTALVDQFINSSTIIRHSISLATIEVTVFVNSTSNTVGVLVSSSCTCNRVSIYTTTIIIMIVQCCVFNI